MLVTLSDQTALRLAEAVLTVEDAPRLDLFVAALRDDSDLFDASARCARDQSQLELHSVEDVARWLDHAGIRHLISSRSRETADEGTAWSVLAKAHAVRAKQQQLEQNWDEEFLREKLASLKEFTYGASHELNNPLFNISSRAQFLLRDEPDPERRRRLSTIYAHAMRASKMIDDIALAARIPQPEFETVDAVAVVREVIAELKSQADEQGTRLHVIGDESALLVEADAVQLAVAVREVVINALESLQRTTPRGEVTVGLSSQENNIAIVITDNGPGLDARAKRHLFDPFFSGYEAGRGLGFGLTKCWQIVQAHNGTIVVDSQVGDGCEVTITLPQTR